MMTETPCIPDAAVDWHQRLWRTGSRDAVIGLVREHVAALSPDELYALPPTCRPARIDSAEDVARCAFYLLSERCGGARRSTAVLHRLASFFSAASTRLTQLTAR